MAGAVAGTTGRLVNLSVRTNAGKESNPLIVGFVVAGAATRSLLVCGVGPTLGAFGVAGALADFGVPGALANPRLQVFESSGRLVAENDNWSTASNAGAVAAAVGAFALGAGSQDGALVLTLPPGAYTAQVSGVGNATGVGLVEVYEVP